MHTSVSTTASAANRRLALAVSRYHGSITDALRQGASEAFIEAGGSADDLVVVEAPGAFELTALCRALVRRADINGVVALGCVITGETTHDQYILNGVVQGLTSLIVQTGKPIGFGLLTCQTIEQARARAGGAKGNKGAEAMTAVLETLDGLREIDGVQPDALVDSGRSL